MIRSAAIALAITAFGCGVAETGELLCPPGTVSTEDGCLGAEPDFLFISAVPPFGRAPVGGVYLAPLQLQNVGIETVAVELAGIDGGDGAFRIDGAPVGFRWSLGPGQTIGASVRYEPIAGDSKATLRFDPALFETVEGIGVAEAFRCAGGDFGAVAVGTCRELEVTCTNDTDYAVDAQSFALIGAEGFRPVRAVSGHVRPGGELRLPIELCPDHRGPYQGRADLLAIVPGGQNTSSKTIRGEGGGGETFACDAQVFLGPVPAGSTETARALCRADGPTTIAEVQLAPGRTPGLVVELRVNGMPRMLPSTVDPNDVIALEIAFTPTMAGRFMETLQIRHDGGVALIAIFAEAVGRESCRLEVQPSIDFGAVPLGQRVEANALIQNVGFVSCSLDFLGLEPGSDPAFSSVVPLPGQSFLLDSGASLLVTAAFAPMQAGLHSGTLSFLAEDMSRPQIALTGRALPEQHGYSVTTVPNTPLVPAGGASLVFTNADDGSTSVPIGFPFEFAGVPVATALISTNGIIGFDGPIGIESISNTPLPSRGLPNALIAWWWDDLHTASPAGPISTITSTIAGAAPQRVRTFTFLDVTGFSSQTPIVSAEARLYESTNVIEVHYGPIMLRANDFTASAGWESFDGSAGADVLGCSPSCGGLDWPESTILRYTPDP